MKQLFTHCDVTVFKLYADIQLCSIIIKYVACALGRVSSGIFRRVVWEGLTDVLEVPAASIISAQHFKKKVSFSGRYRVI